MRELRPEEVEAERELFSRLGAKGRKVKLSAAWLSKRFDCTLSHIREAGGCGGVCCTGRNRWPSSRSPTGDYRCAYLGTQGCTLSRDDKPIGCSIFPIVENGNGTWVMHHRSQFKTSGCGTAFGKGPALIDAQGEALTHLFGFEQFQRARADILAGRDAYMEMTRQLAAQWTRELKWEKDGIFPLPRSTPLDGKEAL